MAYTKIHNRHHLIVEYIKRNSRPSTKGIHKYLVNLGEMISKRTVERDIENINYNLGFEIERKGSHPYFWYEIESEPEADQMASSYLEFAMMAELMRGELEHKESYEKAVYLDHPFSEGTHHVPRIVPAIRKNHKLCIEHAKFEEDGRERIICPLYLKQFRKRWYVIARDTEDGIIKSFGLDRISSVTELAEEFKKNPNEVADAIFTNVIGLFHKDGEPTTIRFWSGAYNANYLRTLKLHQSQIEIGPLNDGFEFEIKVVTNPEFFYEILKMGENVKVLSPESVRTEMRGIAKTLTSYYS